MGIIDYFKNLFSKKEVVPPPAPQKKPPTFSIEFPIMVRKTAKNGEAIEAIREGLLVDLKPEPGDDPRVEVWFSNTKIALFNENNFVLEAHQEGKIVLSKIKYYDPFQPLDSRLGLITIAINSDNFICACFLAGWEHRDGTKVADKLATGTQLTLQRDPDNEFDKKAIRVLFDNYFIGYIPKATNSTFKISQAMDQEKIVNSFVVFFDKGERSFTKLCMAIYIVK